MTTIPTPCTEVESDLDSPDFDLRVYLFRIAEALERANDLKLAELELNHPEYAKTRRTPSAKSPRMVVRSVASAEEWNKNYEARKAEIAQVAVNKGLD